MRFPGEPGGFIGAAFHGGVGRGLLRRLQDEGMELRRSLLDQAAQLAGPFEGRAGVSGGFREVALFGAERGQGEPALGDVGVARELRGRREDRQRLGQQRPSPGEIFGAQAGLRGLVAGQG